MNHFAIAFLILLGAAIMLLSTLNSRRILALLTRKDLIRYWQILTLLMAFFLVGYLAASVLVAAGYSEILVTLAGVVFFFGALFVFIVVRLGFTTITDLLKKTSEISNPECEFGRTGKDAHRRPGTTHQPDPDQRKNRQPDHIQPPTTVHP